MTTPDGRDLPQPPTNPPSVGQSAVGNTGPTVQVGGSNVGNINITRLPKLPVTPIPRGHQEAALEPVWAHTPTPQRAANLLAAHGLAVILGERGTGRRTSAVRALHTHLSTPAGPTQLFYLAADWDEDEAPEREVLPEPVSGHGYLIDATSRLLSENAAHALITWAEQLHDAGGCLVITSSQRDWRGDSRFEIVAVRPDAVQVARKHLAHWGSDAQAGWLQQDAQRTVTRGLLRQAAPDRTAGVLSDLITPSVSPADAVAIAGRLRDIDPERLAAAVERSDSPSSSEREQGVSELRRIREEVLLWTNFLEQTLTGTGTRGQDRVMLLAAAYLEGAPLELCIKAAVEFGARDGAIARRYREGRSPRRRLRDVGVDITSSDTAAFHRRPGLALAAIRMDWHHWADERDATTEWLARITAPDGVARAWTEQIGSRLLQLSITEVESPFLTLLNTWTTTSADERHLRIVTALITQAAETEELARDAHKQLLDWAAKGNAHRRKVVAWACSGRYGMRWPHMALVRLRHILAVDDEATRIAATALTAHAAASTEGFQRVVETVETWFEKYQTHLAGPRAFLALTDPAYNVLDTLVSAAQAAPAVRDFLINGWMQTLRQPDVRDDAHQVLLGWARAAHEGRLDRTATFGILTDVRNAHTPLDAMSRFLYGSPDKDDHALIEARLALANLRACNHTQCSEPHCPLKEAAGSLPDTSAAGGTGEPPS
ncbi:MULTISPECIES: hypothetical protein [Streptomyces]|uniref:hypothetical protein n=1 Tax=Streptomyces TaxID=1883 RepID=UPI00073DBDFD|nr:hypothetical protein [Streptomyces sp. EAS-AB2608]MYU31008.1 hypothetical protein [Streptomyces sp. SID7810]BCM70403.1 hypothetical protein EASAB2608_05737 [Streptomyces sp. EAS-AB2608]CUW32104.1 hypothetical protein TUE45_06853 [Streptomyces reticuli]